MPPADDIETRLSIVERDVAELREQLVLTSSDGAAARTLAAGADQDVSEVRAELRAHTQALNALRETQLEQGREMREGFAEQGRRIDENVREMREGFSTLATGMAQITALLTDRGSEGSRIGPRPLRSMWHQAIRSDPAPTRGGRCPSE